MEVTFEGANSTQEAACQTALHNLLNLPFDSIPLNLTIAFVPDPAPGDDEEFAASTYEYDSTTATIKIDEDAPDWNAKYKGIEFLQETVAHEVGHVMFAAMPESYRSSVAQMFGAKSDDFSELQPEGSAWQNRYIEGIAETFKDAFLPRRFRKYANRTNRNTSISKYSTFRTLFRKGIEAIPSTPGYSHDVLELDVENLKTEWDSDFQFVKTAANTWAYVYTAGYDLFERKIGENHTFEYQFDLPKLPKNTETSPQSFVAWRYKITVNGETKSNFRGAWAAYFLSNPEFRYIYASWYQPPTTEFDLGEELSSGTGPAEKWIEDSEGSSTVKRFEDAISVGDTPCTVNSSVEVSPGDSVVIHARVLALELTTPGSGGEKGEKEALEKLGWLKELYGEALPTMKLVEDSSSGGEAIQIPQSEVTSLDPFSGQRIKDRLITGFWW